MARKKVISAINILLESAVEWRIRLDWSKPSIEITHNSNAIRFSCTPGKPTSFLFATLHVNCALVAVQQANNNTVTNSPLRRGIEPGIPAEGSRICNCIIYYVKKCLQTK